MANKGGIVTRKDMFSDDALNFGVDYSKNIKLAIDSNKILVDSVKELNKQVLSFKSANSQKDYLAAKKQEILLTQQALNAIKTQEAAEISANKIKAASLVALSAERKAEMQLIKAQEAAEIAGNKTKISSIAATEAERKAKVAVLAAEERIQRQKLSGQKLTAEEMVNQRILARNANDHALANSKLATEYEKLTAKTRIAAVALQNILLAGKKAGESTEEYNARLRQAQTEFDALQSRVVMANRAIGRFNDNVGNYPREAAQALRDLIGAFGFVIGIQTFVSIMKDAFQIIREFEKEVVNLAAIAGKTRAEIAPLEAEIRKVAASSINSATDVAKLATELIKLGSTAEEAEKLLAPVNNLSIALQASAEDSATLVKSILNAYGEGAEAAGKVTDILAESANRSALDFAGLRDSFSYLAPTANALNIPISKTAAIIGTLADNGIRAESAGRLTSTAFARLAKDGITLDQALNKIVTAQNDGSSSLEVLSIATELFGAEAGKIGLILANNIEKIDQSTIAYENSGGALKELTDKQLRSADAEIRILTSSWQEYLLKTNDAAGGTQAITSVIRFLSSNLESLVDGLVLAVAIWAAYKASLILANVQAKIMTLTLRANAAAAVTSATGQTANAAATNVATAAWTRFNTALKANILGIVIAALLFFISTMNAYGKSVSEATKETQAATQAFLKNREIVAKNAVSINTLSDRYDVLKGKTKLTTSEQNELNEIIKILAKTVPGAVTEINKYGDALAINTKQTRAFAVAQKEAMEARRIASIESNKKNLKLLQDETKALTVSKDKNKQIYVDEIGFIYEKNGQLVKRSRLLQIDEKLTADEYAIFKEKVALNEKNIIITQQNIKNLEGLTDAEKEAAKAAEINAEKKKEIQARTIAIIDAEIKAQEDLISTLSDKTGKEGRAIQAKIKALNDERDLIYNTNKAAGKSNDDLAKKQIDNARKVRDAIYNLSQFRYSNEIELNKKIVDNENLLIEQRLSAQYENQQIRLSKNEETLRYELQQYLIDGAELEKLTAKKRELYIKSAKDRIESIVSGRLETTKMNASELLILEKFLADKKKLEESDATDKQTVIDSEVDKIAKTTAAELQAQDTKLQQALEAENILYLATLEGFANIEDANEEHERRILEVKKQFAREGIAVQIAAIEQMLAAQDALPESERISADLRAKYDNDLARLKKENSDLNVENAVSNNKVIIEDELAKTQRILQMSADLASVLTDLANAIYGSRIQKIEEEIQANEDFYNRQIELAQNDERQKALLEEEKKKKNDALEEKKKKEQHKAAVFNKAAALAQATISASLAVLAALSTQPFLPLGPAMATLAGVLGAVQIGAIVATKIPKYKGGRTGGPAEFAFVGDGGVNEVIERKSGGIEITPAKDTLVKLEKDDKVHSSIGDYLALQRAAAMASINIQGKKSTDFQAKEKFKDSYSKEILDELRKQNEALKNKKTEFKIFNNIDIPHSIWKSKNTNWQ